MIWVVGLIFGLVLYFIVPGIPFLAALIMGPIIIGFSIFLQKAFGLDKSE